VAEGRRTPGRFAKQFRLFDSRERCATVSGVGKEAGSASSGREIFEKRNRLEARGVGRLASGLRGGAALCRFVPLKAGDWNEARGVGQWAKIAGLRIVP